MPYIRLNRYKRPSFDTWPLKTSLVFPKGLLGFECLTRFSLIGYQEELPYLTLESEENDAISFRIIDPFPINPFYEPVITQADLNDIGVTGDAKLIVLAIVNLSSRIPKMNLEAPLLIYWNKRRGKQLLFPGDSSVPVRFS